MKLKVEVHLKMAPIFGYLYVQATDISAATGASISHSCEIIHLAKQGRSFTVPVKILMSLTLAPKFQPTQSLCGQCLSGQHL